MNESLHLIIDYLLMDERKNLESKSHDWLIKVRYWELILDVHGMCRIDAFDAC